MVSSNSDIYRNKFELSRSQGNEIREFNGKCSECGSGFVEGYAVRCQECDNVILHPHCFHRHILSVHAVPAESVIMLRKDDGEPSKWDGQSWEYINTPSTMTEKKETNEEPVTEEASPTEPESESESNTEPIDWNGSGQ